ncbi:hypothetical protein KUA50_002565 [Segatella hominis]|nr:hypothetical protein [Segatella hominis]WOZ81867.1 hypothetical protein KUA50_002565 [Segatella hominis]
MGKNRAQCISSSCHLQVGMMEQHSLQENNRCKFGAMYLRITSGYAAT